MPYSAVSELPDQFDVLPEDGKKLALEVINSMISRGEPEESAFQAAWSQVGKNFNKSDSGKWTAKESDNGKVLDKANKPVPDEMHDKEHKDNVDTSTMDAKASVDGKDMSGDIGKDISKNPSDSDLSLQNVDKSKDKTGAVGAKSNMMQVSMPMAMDGDKHKMMMTMTAEAVWDTFYVNDLPDDCFAYVEPGGEKDDEGKTAPRSKRHFPIKDKDGKLDAAHVRNALSRVSQSPFGDKAMSKIKAAADKMHIGMDDMKDKTDKADIKDMKETRESEDYEGIILEAADSTGAEWDVLLVKRGWSLNKNYYPLEVLHRDYAVFEGVPVYAASGPDHNSTERGVRAIAGWVHDVNPHPMGAGGKVHLSDMQLREAIRDAWSHGKRNLFGLSIRADGDGQIGEAEGSRGRLISALTKGHSVDIVCHPSAGGGFLKLLESHQEDKMPEEKDKDTVVTPDPVPVVDVNKAVAEAVAAAEAKLIESLNTTKRQISNTTLDSMLRETTLPVVSQKRLREQFKDQVDLDTIKLEEAIGAEKDYLAAIMPAPIKDMGVVSPAGRMGKDDKDKLVEALDGYFNGADMGTTPRGRSYMELYSRFSGMSPYNVNPDDLLAGLCRKTGRGISLEEALTTSDWGNVFADRLRKRLLDAYAEPLYDSWRKISQIVDLPDYYTHRYSRVGGYAMTDANSQVSEGGTYPTATSPGDEEVAMTAVKRGTTEYITKEMLLGDHLGAIPRIPVALARWMKRLVHLSIWVTILEDNATSYDTEALFVASASGSRGQYNTSALALSGSTIQTARAAMRAMTAYGESTFTLGALNEPRFLVVPNELQALGERLVAPSNLYIHTATTSTDAGIDPNAFRGLELIVVDELTDANDFYLIADPRKVPVMLVGFVQGIDTPNMLVADIPNAGSYFSADKIGYRVDMAWDAEPADYRSFYNGTA